MIRTGKAGSGTYGIVYTAQTADDEKREVAIKRNIVDDSVSFSGSIKELDILNRLKGHPYIVKLISVSFGNPMIAPNSPICRSGGLNYREDYLHFIFEKGNNNGHSLIYGNGVHVSYLKLAMVQMFLGIEYMHKNSIIHRDLKPANLLWFVSSDNKAAIKICDFGLSKICTTNEPMTPKVVTCWYRAPEICSRDPAYTFKSDIWSAGCILYEMVAKKALLYRCSNDDTKLLSKIVGLIPDPSYNDIYKITQGHQIKLTKDASPRNRLTFRTKIDMSDEDIEEFEKFPGIGASSYDQFLDLLGKILVLDPDKRYDVFEVLEHEYFDPYRSMIKDIREKYHVDMDETKIDIICCRERAWACKTAFFVFNGREYLSWYKHRMLFQSIDMFDRYILYLNSKEKRLIPSNYQGKYLTRYYTELHYIICLYMCIKYFTTLHIPISFTDLATEAYKTEKAMIEAEEFEKTMLRDVLKYTVYRDTIYELSPKENEEQIRDLLDAYGNMRKHYKNAKVSDIYLEFI